MHAREISTQTDNHQLSIHYFQDSLIGVAFKWYMGLDSTQIRIFNDLGEVFVCYYKYNVDMTQTEINSVLCPNQIKKLSRSMRRDDTKLLDRSVHR